MYLEKALLLTLKLVKFQASMKNEDGIGPWKRLLDKSSVRMFPDVRDKGSSPERRL